jgi:hypothetical protein
MNEVARKMTVKRAPEDLQHDGVAEDALAGSRDIYVARFEAAAAALVADRLLLLADAAAYVIGARDCDRF